MIIFINYSKQRCKIVISSIIMMIFYSYRNIHLVICSNQFMSILQLYKFKFIPAAFISAFFHTAFSTFLN